MDNVKRPSQQIGLKVLFYFLCIYTRGFKNMLIGCGTNPGWIYHAASPSWVNQATKESERSIVNIVFNKCKLMFRNWWI